MYMQNDWTSLRRGANKCLHFNDYERFLSSLILQFIRSASDHKATLVDENVRFKYKKMSYIEDMLPNRMYQFFELQASLIPYDRILLLYRILPNLQRYF